MNTIEVIKEMSDIAIQIPQVKKVSDGDVYTNWNSGEIEYGSINIAISNITKQEQTLTYTIYLYYGDRLLQDKSNYTNICTDAEYVLNLIINTLEGEVEEPYDITFFEQQFADYLAGGYVIFNYTVDSNIGECELDFTKPEYTLEIHSNGIFDVKNYDKVSVNVPPTLYYAGDNIDIDENNVISAIILPEQVEFTGSTTLQPNVLYIGEVSGDTTFTKGIEVANRANEYMVKFAYTSGNVTFWNDIVWINDIPQWTSEKTYEISILDNVAVWIAY